jgi:hypothetical protein
MRIWGGYFPGGKAAGADHSPPSSVEVRNGVTTPPLFHSSSWRGAQLMPGETLTLRENAYLVLRTAGECQTACHYWRLVCYWYIFA